MDCYVCNAAPGPGGTRYGVRPAVGTCHTCGIGICAVHAERGAAPGLPLLCPDHVAHPRESRVVAAAGASRGAGT